MISKKYYILFILFCKVYSLSPNYLNNGTVWIFEAFRKKILIYPSHQVNPNLQKPANSQSVTRSRSISYPMTLLAPHKRSAGSFRE